MSRCRLHENQVLYVAASLPLNTWFCEVKAKTKYFVGYRQQKKLHLCFGPESQPSGWCLPSCLYPLTSTFVHGRPRSKHLLTTCGKNNAFVWMLYVNTNTYSTLLSVFSSACFPLPLRGWCARLIQKNLQRQNVRLPYSKCTACSHSLTSPRIKPSRQEASKYTCIHVSYNHQLSLSH